MVFLSGRFDSVKFKFRWVVCYTRGVDITSLSWVPVLAFLGALAGGALTKAIELRSAQKQRRLETLRQLHLILLQSREKLSALHVHLLMTKLDITARQREEILQLVNTFALEFQTAFSLIRLNLPGPWGQLSNRPADFANLRLAALGLRPFDDDEFHIFQIALSSMILAVECEIENTSRISLPLGELFETRRKKRPNNPETS